MHMLTEREILFGLIGCLATVFFAYFDLTQPHGVTVVISYVSILGFGLLARSRRLIVFFGLLGSILSIIGYYYSPEGPYAEFAVINRQLVVVAIATITITSHMFMTQQQEFERIMYKIANTDQLTQIPNRRALMVEIEGRIAEAERYHKELSILLFDIDDFKKINDQHGHLFGDKILIDISKVCMDWLRDTDFIGRYGGEEFLIICPHTSLEGAVALGERIRTAIESKSFSKGLKTTKTTISVGVSTYNNELNTLERLLNSADQALYRAKAAGKNCVRSIEEPANVIEPPRTAVS